MEYCRIYVTFKADTNNTVDINHRFSFPCFETKYHPNPISRRKKGKIFLHYITIQFTLPCTHKNNFNLNKKQYGNFSNILSSYYIGHKIEFFSPILAGMCSVAYNLMFYVYNEFLQDCVLC